MGATIDREYSTPPAIAELLGIDVDKVRTWILAGELKAVDVATTTGGRPRWRISRQDLEEFLIQRSSSPPPKPKQRRRKPQRSKETAYF